MSDGLWRFRWTSQPTGMCKGLEAGWVMEGRPSDPDTGWIIAHDVFHHAPEDTGTYAQEVASFGAQTRLEEPSCMDLARSMADSWFGVMSMVIEHGKRGVKGLHLKETPANPAEPRYGAAWRQAYLMALHQTHEAFRKMGEPQAWKELASEAMIQRAVAWVSHGYDSCRARWPDIQATRAMFEQVWQAADAGHEGELLVVRIDHGHLEINRIAGAGS